jgi:rRNA maturation RNase YbeY
LGFIDAELSILLTGDPGARELNRKYRAIDRPTDVLSFPMGDETLLGSIAISVDTAKRQAKGLNVTLGEELSRLVVHGILHLAGYDHARGGRQARKMRDKEDELLKALKAEGCF